MCKITGQQCVKNRQPIKLLLNERLLNRTIEPVSGFFVISILSLRLLSFSSRHLKTQERTKWKIDTHRGPSKSIIAPAWYQVTLLGGISCTSTIQVRLIVLPLFTYSSSGPVIFACTSDINQRR